MAKVFLAGLKALRKLLLNISKAVKFLFPLRTIQLIPLPVRWVGFVTSGIRNLLACEKENNKRWGISLTASYPYLISLWRRY